MQTSTNIQRRPRRTYVKHTPEEVRVRRVSAVRICGASVVLTFGVKKTHGLHALEAKSRAESIAHTHDILREAGMLPHQQPATNSRAEMCFRDRLEDHCFAVS